MAPVMAEAESAGRERGDEDGTQTGRSAAATGFVFDQEGDALDDELATLMPALKKRFEAFDENEGSLNFMGEIKMDNNEESFRYDPDKENVASAPPRRSFRDRNTVRPASGRLATRKPIDYKKLFAMNKTLMSPPSGSLSMAKKKTVALKENVNNAANHNVDDFWEIERQKKISAVARRKLSGLKTPQQTKPQVVENRFARHARSRRAGGYERKMSKQPMKLDLAFYASKISEWDQEFLAEEEAAPSTRAQSGTFTSTGRRRELQAKLSDLDQRKEGVKAGTSAGAEGENASQSKEAVLEDGNERHHPGDVLLKADSPSSLPDMDCSAGESPLAEAHAVWVNGKDGENPQRDGGNACPTVAEEASCSGERDKSMLRDPVGQEAEESSSCVREDAGGDEIYQQDPRPRDSNLEEDTSLTPFGGFPVLETCNAQQRRIPVTSPTPPSNPVAVYLARRRLEDVRQRKLHFITSPSKTSATGETGEVGKEQTDLLEAQSGMDQFLNTSKEDVQDEQCLLGESEAERDTSDHEDQMSASNRDVEARDPPCREESLAVSSCDRGGEINDGVTMLKATEERRNEADSGGNRLSGSPQRDDSPSQHNQILSTTACIVHPGENALLAIVQEYPTDEDLDVPDVGVSGPAPSKSDGTTPAQQPEPASLAHGHAESVDEVAVPLFDDSVDEVPVVEAQTLAEPVNETEDRQEPCVETHNNCAPVEDAICPDEDSTTQTNPKITKKKARKSKDKRRFSLEDCGTLWKDGQRRSQRKRVRPLEWWRGEKLLYGRINQSLQTVIGIKYSSPGKYAAGLHDPFTVESYVGDEYSALVKAAL